MASSKPAAAALYESCAVTIVKVTMDISGALAKLEAAAKQGDYATAVALTKTAKIVQADLRSEMQRVFTSAVPFTLNSLYVKSASKSDQTATVGVKTQGRTSASNWLLPEIVGGLRHGGIEVFLKPIGLPPPGMFATPAGAAPLTGAGKLNVNAIKRIVTQLAGQPQGANALQVLKRRRTGSKIAYFALPRAVGSLHAGIYGRRGHEILPILYFVKQPSYRKKFNFYEVGTASAQRNFPIQFRLAMANALRTAR
jgi:hypothetical protein